MPHLSRRRLLQGAGAAVTAAFAAEYLPPNVRRALAAGPAQGASLSDIKHVVILMQENRSFDHYFGTLPNVRGFADPTAIQLSTGKSVFYQPDTQNPDGYLLPFHLDTRTTEAGVGWQVYQDVDNYECNLLEMFASFQAAPAGSTFYQSGLRTFSPGQFEYDAIHDRLPTVSWIIPTSYQSEHPDYTPAAGADFVASKIDAIASNPEVWNSTVFILNYDENDGLFDHVVPPTAPLGTAGEYVDSLPIGAGFRVPCVIVSPWTVGGYVCHDTFDHTSVLRLLEKVTGVTNPNISAWRRKTVGDFTSALGAAPSRRVPRLPGTTRELEQAEAEVQHFALPPIPGKKQSFPVQGKGHKKVRNGATANPTAVGV